MKQDLISDNYIDLRGVECPLNFIRCRLALESLKTNEFLHVDLDQGEPENMVIPGLRKDGHRVDIIRKESTWLKLIITCYGEGS